MSSMAYPYPAGAPMSRRQSMTPYYGDQRPLIYSPPASYNVTPYPGTPTPIPLTRRMSSQSYDDYASSPYFPSHRRNASTPRPVVANMQRHRRHSTVSFTTGTSQGMVSSMFRRSSVRIKFKRKGSFLGGVGLGEAQRHGLRLANGGTYYISDMHPDRRDTVYVKMSWAGNNELTYQIPLDSYHGRLDLETLARRVSRSCVHYFQTYRIPISWDRLELKSLEEIDYGVWQPVLSAN